MDTEKILKKLVSFDSTKENPKARRAIINYVYSLFKGRAQMRILTKGDVDSLIIAFTKKSLMNPRVTIHGHLDVVVGKKDQFVLKKTKTQYIGRGTQDMKGACAVFIKLIDDCIRKGIKPDINFLFTTDEEMAGFDGAGYTAQKGLCPKFVITGESTDLKISLASKGVIWVKIVATGKPAHSAYLFEGDSAVMRLNTVLNKLNKAFPLPKDAYKETTVNVAFINTANQTVNKVPDRVESILDFRYFTGRDRIMKFVKSLANKNVSVEIIEDEPAVKCSKQNPYVSRLAQLVGNKNDIFTKKLGGSDVRHFAKIGIPGVEFGPSGSGLHSDDERLDIKSLERFSTILTKFIETIA